jgi:ABC-type phosphate transport system auxiliary subunit
LNKRKRGEDTRSKSSAGRVVEWKARPDPEENIVQEASALHTFAGLNASSILEVTNALNTAKTRVTELEAELRDVEDMLTSKFENAARVADTLNTKNLNRALQEQRDQMNAEFEIRIKTQWDTHNNELDEEI